MADDRPILDPVEAIAQLQRDLEDFRTTAAVRMLRRPTGDIEPTLRSTAKAGCLLLQGQTVNRADYQTLWTWIQENGLAPSVFGNGNGTTTFVLPDARGRVLMGSGTLGADTYALGAIGGTAKPTISTAQMPGHDHNVSTSSAGGHTHGFSTDSAGSHGGHSSGTANVVPPGSGITLPSNYSGSSGSHSHGGGTENAGSHSHSTNESTVGGGQAFDVRQPYFVGNWQIWA